MEENYFQGCGGEVIFHNGYLRSLTSWHLILLVLTKPRNQLQPRKR